MTESAGWHPDPNLRHEYRYWDGSVWTDTVADSGLVTLDPLIPVPASPAGAAWQPPAATAEPPRSHEPTWLVVLRADSVLSDRTCAGLAYAVARGRQDRDHRGGRDAVPRRCGGERGHLARPIQDLHDAARRRSTRCSARLRHLQPSASCHHTNSGIPPRGPRSTGGFARDRRRRVAPPARPDRLSRPRDPDPERYGVEPARGTPGVTLAQATYFVTSIRLLCPGPSG